MKFGMYLDFHIFQVYYLLLFWWRHCSIRTHTFVPTFVDAQTTFFLPNIGCTHDAFDYCHVDTWSLGMMKYCLSRLDYDPTDPLVKVYWVLPGKDIMDGLVCVDTEEAIAAMVTASKEAKTLDVIVDKENKIRTLYGDDVILNRCPTLPRKLPRSVQFVVVSYV